MGLTMKQRQAVMEELWKQYRHTPPKEKSRILDEFVDQGASQPLVARSTLRAKGVQGKAPVHRPRASVYTAAVLPALTEFWHLSDRLCGKRLVPFPLLGIHSEYGSEFMNNHLIRTCHQQHITKARSRPYRKNDNCFVEQKNWSIVRRTVWYLRYDTEEEVLLMNKIYQSLRLFTTFFLPVMQLTRKIRQGAKVTRSYDVPSTPYERVLASPCITEQAKEALRAQEQHLDPVALHERILQDQRRPRDLVLTRDHDQPHIIPRKAKDWQLHPVSR